MLNEEKLSLTDIQMPRKPKSCLCAICGKEKATTKDHIPPKGIFAKPYPKNLITVPACSKCNNGASNYDEAFRIDLSLHVGVDTPETETFWKEGALKTLHHQRKLRQQKINDLKPGYLSTPSGIIYKQCYVGHWNSKAHNTVVERIIRGLYYHHCKEILGNRATCDVQWLSGLDGVYDLSKEWPQYNIGNDFIYRWCFEQGNPLSSLWIFQFYKRHWASGYTTPVGKGPNI